MAEVDRLQKKLASHMGEAIGDYSLIEEGDHLLVCLSGGKDSYTMLDLLIRAKRRAPIDFQLTAFHLDQKQPGYPEGVLREYLEDRGIAFEILEEDTYSVVKEKLDPGDTPCSLCSRLRRGIIYGRADALGCNKIALGHHRDDSVETLLLNLFFSGQMQAMPASYTTDDGRFQVIRPLIYAAESDIARYSELRGFPIIPCNLCGSIDGQRKYMKGLLDSLEERIPDIRNSVMAATQNVRPTHLLDKSLQGRSEGSESAPATGCGGDLF